VSLCAVCGGEAVETRQGTACTLCGAGASYRPRSPRRRVNRATCGHRRWTAGTVRHVNGERREVSRCVRCGEERQVEA
jgi:hypothetical protein